MKATSRKITAGMATLAAAALLAVAPTAANAAEGSDIVSAPPVESFDVVVGGEKQTIEANVPWRLVQESNGEVQLNVGPGVIGKLYTGTVLASWDGPKKTSSQRLASGNWSCIPQAHSPVGLGRHIKGFIGADCVGSMPQWRQQWQFERDGFSLTGWVQYAPGHYTNWTSSNYQATDVYAWCNSTQNVTRAYTTYHRGEAVGGYQWGWHRSPNSDRMNCGDSSPG